MMRVEKDVWVAITITTIGLPPMLSFCTFSTNTLTTVYTLVELLVPENPSICQEPLTH